MRLIDADKLKSSQTYDLFHALEQAPTVQAIPLDRVKQAIEEIDRYVPKYKGPKWANTITVDIRDVHRILNKLIEESEETDGRNNKLAEGIRCAMCTNSMKNDRGCDGGCVVDEDMYKKVMETIKNQMFNQPTSDDCVSRADLLKMYENRYIELQKAHQMDKQLGVNWCINTLEDAPPVTPTHGTCKDCKRSHELSKGSIVCDKLSCIGVEKDFYCADFKERGSENERV